MAKTAGDVSELDKLRGETWVNHCLAVADCKTLSKLHAKVPVLSSVDLWSKYRGGKAKPLESTVRAVNLLLPSTADTWFQGPHGQPLWSVLTLDLAASRQLVERAIAEQLEGRLEWMLVSKVPVHQMDNLQLVQALLELTIFSAWVRPVPEPDMSDWKAPSGLSDEDEIDARFEEEERRREVARAARRPEWLCPQDHYYSLAEVIRDFDIPRLQNYYFRLRDLATSWGEQQALRLRPESPTVRDWMVRGELRKFPILTKERAVALLAAAVVCNGSEELLLKDLAYILTTAFKPLVLDHFGDGVAQFVEDNI